MMRSKLTFCSLFFPKRSLKFSWDRNNERIGRRNSNAPFIHDEGDPAGSPASNGLTMSLSPSFIFKNLWRDQSKAFLVQSTNWKTWSKFFKEILVEKQSFSKFHVNAHHLGIMLKCRHWLSMSGAWDSACLTSSYVMLIHLSADSPLTMDLLCIAAGLDHQTCLLRLWEREGERVSVRVCV